MGSSEEKKKIFENSCRPAQTEIERENYGFQDLRCLLQPRNIAVIGASEKEHSFGSNTIQNLIATFEGRIYPVNPKHKKIHGLKAYPSVESLPDVPDCAVLAIPGAAVIEECENCANKGVGALIIYSSGFAELGDEGVVRQRRLTEISAETGMRILGPNCIGIAIPGRGMGLTFMPSYRDMPQISGDIGLVSQSGAMGYVVLQAMQRGIGFSRYLTTGNAADVDVADLINALVDDPETKSIACMFEGVANPHRFIAATRRALEAGKPVVVLKLGRSDVASDAAKSHTGALIGVFSAYRAVFDRTGVVMVEDFEALLETVTFLGRAGQPRSKGVAVLGPSGGASILAADIASDLGISLPQPSVAARARIEASIPQFGYAGNPADMTAESVRKSEMYTETIKAYDSDPSYGAIVVAMASAHATVSHARAEAICETARNANLPICVVWLNEWHQGPGSEVYDSSSELTIFRSVRRCLNTINAWQHYYERRPELLARSAEEPGRQNRTLFSGEPGILSESQSKQLLNRHGVHTSRGLLVNTVQDAVLAAKEIGFPVVMKADSVDLPHKSEAGVIRLNIQDVDALHVAWNEIMEAIGRVAIKPRLNGILIQEMVRGDLEVMVGTKRDPQFGQLIICGLGGVMVELLDDTSVALAPVDKNEALRMIKSLKGYKLLTGFRGKPAVDIDAFADVICNISKLAAGAEDSLEEIDINPLLLSREAAVAVDALVVTREGEAEIHNE